jgi:hypothetical protein
MGRITLKKERGKKMTHLIQIFKELGFKKENLLFIVLITINLFFSYTSYMTTREMDARELNRTKEAGLTVLKAVSAKQFTTADEINDFLSEKPAGRNDLKNACNDTYDDLKDNYGKLAVDACSIFH